MKEKSSLDDKLKIIDTYLNKKYFKEQVDTKDYLRTRLKKLAKHLGDKPFTQATEDEIITVMESYAPSGYSGLKSCYENFYRYIYNLEEDDKLPDCVRFLKKKKSRQKRKEGKEIQIRERLITPEEYKLIISNSTKPYQRAIIETLYLFGCRISELLSMKANSIIEGETITKIIVYESKTEPREIPIDETPHHLLDYYHTEVKDKRPSDSPFWLSPHFNKGNKVFKRTAIPKMIQSIAMKAGITKRITPHDFRHTAISRDLARGIPPTHVETKYGLEKDTQMIKVYDHNGNVHLEEWYLKNLIETPNTRLTLERQLKKKSTEDEIRIINLENQLKETNNKLDEIQTESAIYWYNTGMFLLGDIAIYNYDVYKGLRKPDKEIERKIDQVIDIVMNSAIKLGIFTPEQIEELKKDKQYKNNWKKIFETISKAEDKK